MVLTSKRLPKAIWRIMASTMKFWFQRSGPIFRVMKKYRLHKNTLVAGTRLKRHAASQLGGLFPLERKTGHWKVSNKDIIIFQTLCRLYSQN